MRDDTILTKNLHDEKIASEENLQWLVRSQKYKMFFAGLIFAIISFIGANPIHTTFLWVKILELISSFSLLFAGILLLLRLSDITFRVGENKNTCKIQQWLGIIIFNSTLSYWILFLIGMFLLVLNRAILLFSS